MAEDHFARQELGRQQAQIVSVETRLMREIAQLREELARLEDELAARETEMENG